jgi:hypothetical protein
LNTNDNTLDAATEIPAERLLTQRDCVRRCAWIFGAALVACLLAQWLLAVLFFGRHTAAETAVRLLPALGLAAYILAPLAAALGAFLGYDLNRLATGARQPKETHGCIWVIGFLLLQWIVVFLYLQTCRRNALILERGRPSGVGPALYAALIVCWILLAGGVANEDTTSWFVGAAFTTGVLSLFFADCLAVNAIARWNNEGLLAAPSGHTFQFSLSTLFFGTLALGAYASGLALIVRHVQF